MKSVSNNANVSLFVDDFAVYIEGKHLKHLERTMQLCINKIRKWVVENGFKFSILKKPVSIFTSNIYIYTHRTFPSPGWPRHPGEG